ncbi:choice-of-anchor J domain-containing protein [Marinicella sp. W31]|uniref:choice-of-anchor J domain-containing protein n=1 Tax=Marinicella sp. W31 TaxID=3023713 RepID=UPI00375679AE
MDNDGNTPDPSVSEFIIGWLVSENRINPQTGNFTIQSTSWYSPPSTSDDWLITPAINIGVREELMWAARSTDSNFLESYVVYFSTTTPTIAGCLANPPLFTISGENSSVFVNRAIDLAAVGHANQAIYVCFRHTSTDQFILEIDDIQVAPIFDNDLVINAVAPLPEYTIVSDAAVSNFQIPLSVEVLNNGKLAQNNFTVAAEVLLDDVTTSNVGLTVTTPLDPGVTTTVDLGLIGNLAQGIYDVNYSITLDGVVDENPSDNTLQLENVLTVDPNLMARDDDVAEGSLGIGAGNIGQLGQDFVIDQAVVLSSVYFRHSNTNCDGQGGCTLDNQQITVDILDFDAINGRPGNIIASSEIYTVAAGEATEIDVQLNFVGEDLELDPGRYVIVVNEPLEVNVQLLTSNDRATPGTTWINWPASPLGDWGNNEQFNFFNTYILRATFEENTDLIFKNGFD